MRGHHHHHSQRDICAIIYSKIAVWTAQLAIWTAICDVHLLHQSYRTNLPDLTNDTLFLSTHSTGLPIIISYSMYCVDISVRWVCWAKLSVLLQLVPIVKKWHKTTSHDKLNVHCWHNILDLQASNVALIIITTPNTSWSAFCTWRKIFLPADGKSYRPHSVRLPSRTATLVVWLIGKKIRLDFLLAHQGLLSQEVPF